MPKPQDLADLFNFEFNREGSCLIAANDDDYNDWNDKTQSKYLFFKKFKGKEGLVKCLKSDID